jgi:transposase-like protein
MLSKEFLSQFKTEADVCQFLKQLHSQVLEKKWGGKYPYAILSWRRNWDDLTIFFQFP